MNEITRWKEKRDGPKPVCWQAHLGSGKGRRPPIQDMPPSGLFPQRNTGTARGTTEAEEGSFLSLKRKRPPEQECLNFYSHSSLLPFILYKLLFESSPWLLVQHLWKTVFSRDRSYFQTLFHPVKRWRATGYGQCHSVTALNPSFLLFFFTNMHIDTNAHR